MTYPILIFLFLAVRGLVLSRRYQINVTEFWLMQTMATCLPVDLENSSVTTAKWATLPVDVTFFCGFDLTIARLQPAQ